MYSTKCTVHVRTVPKILGTVHFFGTFLFLLFLRCTSRLTGIITWLPLTQIGSMSATTDGNQGSQEACNNQLSMYLRQFNHLSEEANSKLKGMKPQDYWATIGKAKFPLLAPLAARLFSIPPSNCSSKRNWSLSRNIITKQRNRRATDKAEKLVFVQTNSYLLDEEGQTDYLNELHEE